MNTRNNCSRYPLFNEHYVNYHPVLSAYGKTPLGELVWIVIPFVLLALAFLIR
jgi:hypothetical protein